MANVILIRPISESWDGELYKRALSIPHGPLTLAAHLIHKGFSANIIDEIALTDIIKTEISTKAIKSIEIAGGFDKYIVSLPNNKLSVKALKLKKAIKKKTINISDNNKSKKK